ncbi:hypothetical protein Peur_030912 [Populus x canadensis]
MPSLAERKMVGSQDWNPMMLELVLRNDWDPMMLEFKGTATLGSPGDSRYPDELARWTKSFRESASESQVSLLRLFGWHKIPPHFTLCKNNDKCLVEMRREDGS